MRFVVRPHRPWRQLALVLLAVALLSLAGALLLDYGHWRYIYDRMAANAGQRQSWQLSRATEQDNIRLRERVAVLERSAQVDQQAYRELRRLVAGLQDDNYLLREELEFYRGVMGARTGKELRIQALSVQALDRAGEYRLKLVLTRAVKDDSVARGGVDISVEGDRGGRTLSLGLAAVTSGQTQTLPFEFKHFRRIESTITLPADFRPIRVRVVLDPSQGAPASVVRVFDWDQVLDTGENRRHVG